MRILVGYASAHGSTADIAQRIADVLQGEGLTVEVLPVQQVQSLDGYDGVVLGSAIHNQAWLPEATAFVHRHRTTLVSRPVWLFSVGMSAGLPRPIRRMARAGQDQRLAEALRDVVRPRGHRLFSGISRDDQFPRWVRILFRGIGAHFGDYRDRTEIETWAREIAGELTSSPQAPSAGP